MFQNALNSFINAISFERNLSDDLIEWMQFVMWLFSRTSGEISFFFISKYFLFKSDIVSKLMQGLADNHYLIAKS